MPKCFSGFSGVNVSNVASSPMICIATITPLVGVNVVDAVFRYTEPPCPSPALFDSCTVY